MTEGELQQQRLYEMVFSSIDEGVNGMHSMLLAMGFPPVNVATAVTVAMGSIAGMLIRTAPEDLREPIAKRIAENVEIILGGIVLKPADEASDSADLPDNVIPFPVPGTRLPENDKS